MKKDFVEMVFILDRSGSMAGLEKQTIDGFNEMIAKQKCLVGEAKVTTVLFDHEINMIHDRLDIKEVFSMTNKQYFVRGTTALYDAIGKSIDWVDKLHKTLFDNEKPEKTIFVITTDGMENASQEYRLFEVKRMIEEHQRINHWEFLFLGANIDAIETARTFGISRRNAANYRSDARGTKINYEALDAAICEMRTNKTISPSWKKKIDDYMKDDE